MLLWWNDFFLTKSVSTDPLPVQLIVQFLEQASKPSLNEQNQVQPPADNCRNRTLKLLALKVAAHMKWDLEVLEKGSVCGLFWTLFMNWLTFVYWLALSPAAWPFQCWTCYWMSCSVWAKFLQVWNMWTWICPLFLPPPPWLSSSTTAGKINPKETTEK